MKKIRLMIAALLLVCSASVAYAQGMLVKGTVTDADTGEPLPYVTVAVKGTTQGASTDANGAFAINAPSDGTLVFSFVGYTTAEVPVGGRASIAVKMETDSMFLNEAVVTATGMTRDQKTLGYAAAKVNADQLTLGKSSSIVSGLQGKVAGVQITQAGGTGTSQKVIVRGYSSLGSNNPLYVIDGVPVQNSFSGIDEMNNAVDFGNQAGDINPDEIESVTVLKGASATALYGSRAANGVIIMTTKKGRLNEAVKVSYEGTFMASDVLRTAQFQNMFGQGWYYAFYGDGGYGGAYGVPYSGAALGGWASNENGSWGNRLDGRMHEWDVQAYYAGLTEEPRMKKYEFAKNSVREFFDMGFEMNNSITVQGGRENSSFMFNYGNTYSNGVLPSTADTYKRNNFSFRGHTLLFKGKGYFDYSISYVRKNARNVMSGQGGDGSTIYNDIYQYPNDIHYADLKDYSGVYNNANTFYTPYAKNPWWIVDHSYAKQEDERTYGKLEIGYEFLPNTKIIGRVGGDFSNARYMSYNELWTTTLAGTINYDEASPEIGKFTQNSSAWNQIDASILATGDYHLNDNFGLNLTAGWNINQRTSTSIGGYVQGLMVAGYPSFDNTTSMIPPVSSTISQRRLVGALAQADLNYREMVYLSLSARNDWSSTLPIENNSFFYWGANTAVILSQMIPALQNNKTVNFLKIRAAYGKTGNDAGVYLTNPYYYLGYSVTSGFGSIQMPLDGVNGGTSSTRKATTDLKPEMSTETEFGIDARFFQNRVNIDLSFYNKDTRNQIISATLAPESGYTSKVANVGLINNKGVELMASFIPVRTRDFEWAISYNFSKNINTVKELWEGLEEYAIYSLSGGAALKAKVGESLTTWIYDDIQVVGDEENPCADDCPYKGYAVVNSNTGYPYMSTSKTKVVGNADPDFMMGFGSMFTYKNLSLGFNLDWRHGGLMYSSTNDILYFTGNHEDTIYNERNSFIFPHSVRIVDGEYVENNIPVDMRNTLNNYYNDSSNPYMGDKGLISKSFLKLRDVNLTYKLPKAWFESLPVSDASISLVGRNLLMWTPDQGVIDPEVTNYGNDLTSEFGEFYAAPSVRTFGGSIKLTF